MDACVDVEQLREVWREASAAGAVTAPFKARMKAVLDRLQPAEDASAAEEVETGEPEPNPDHLWSDILKVHGERGDDLSAVRAAFAMWSQGVAVEDANGFQLQDYLTVLTSEQVPA